MAPIESRHLGGPSALFRLIGLTFRLNPGWSSAIAGITIVTGILPALQVTAIRGLMNSVSAAIGSGLPDPAVLAQWLVLLAAAITLPNAVFSLIPVLQAGYRESNAHSLRLAVLDRMTRLDPLAMEDPKTCDLLQRVDDALTRSVQPWSESLVWFFQTLITVIALSGYLLDAHWSILVLAVLGGLVHLWLEASSQTHQYRLFSAQTPLQRWEDYLAGLLTTAAPRRDLLVFGAGPGILGRWKAVMAALRQEQWRLEKRNAWRSLAGQILLLTVYLLPLGGLAWRYTSGQIDIGLVVGILSSLSAFYGGLSLLLVTAAGWIGQGMHAADILQFLRGPGAVGSPPAEVAATETPDRSECAAALAVKRERRGPAVELRNVTFTYPGSAAPALEGIHLRIDPGEWVAIVGANGSGKTTLSRLILGLYQPTSGEVIRHGCPGTSSGTAAGILQDYGRYSLLVRENIGLGYLPHLSDDAQLQEAAKLAGADRLISLGAGWLDAQLGRQFDGLEPSGGQWQRLAVARGLLAPAGLVVLDEATSALDPEAEARLLQDLRTELAGATVLFVAHRLPVARLANRIVVLSEGRIVEQGTHSALMAQDGLYARFFRDQAAWYQPIGGTVV